MPKPRSLLIPVGLTFYLLAINVCGQTSSARPDVTRLQTELEPQINAAISKGRLPGMAIGVVKNGKLIYAKGFGVSKLGTNAAITSRSLFHMASVTKTF